MTIHMFGAYFGLAASYAMGPPPKEGLEACVPDKVSGKLSKMKKMVIYGDMS